MPAALCGWVRLKSPTNVLRSLSRRPCGPDDRLRPPPTVRSKIEMLRLATELDISAPVTVVVQSAGDVAFALERTLLPATIKADQSFGGLGVRLVWTPDEATTGLAASAKPSSLTAASRDHLREGWLSPYQLRKRFQAPRVSVQAGIAGRPANRAVICENGKVIAGVTVRVLKTMEEHGLATVHACDRHGSCPCATVWLVF